MNKIQDFLSWFKLKIRLHTKARTVLFKEREIWWCSLGVNIGDEGDGKNGLFERPVLVIKKINSRLLWIIPTGSMFREGDYYIQCHFSQSFSTLLLSQIRAISYQRLLRKIGMISTEEFVAVRDKIRSFL